MAVSFNKIINTHCSNFLIKGLLLYDQNKSQGHGHYLMKKAFYLFILGITLSILSFGQNKVLLENGSSMSFSHMSFDRDLINIDVNGERRSINKTDILCIIPEKGKSYTFRKTNNMKFKIAKKDIKADYQGADIARIFAYKYYKSKTEASELYKLYSGINITQFDFESYYHAQQQKIRSRATTSTVIAVVILAISVGNLIRVLGEVNSLSYNHMECPEMNSPKVDNNMVWFINQRYYRLKYCA